MIRRIKLALRRWSCRRWGHEWATYHVEVLYFDNGERPVVHMKQSCLTCDETRALRLVPDGEPWKAKR